MKLRACNSNGKHVFGLMLTLLIMVTQPFYSSNSALYAATGTVTPQLPISPNSAMRDAFGIEMVYIPAGQFELGINRDKLRQFCRVEYSDEELNRCLEQL